MCVIVVFKAVDMFCFGVFSISEVRLKFDRICNCVTVCRCAYEYLCMRVEKCVCVMLRVCCAVIHKSTVECMHKNMQKAHSRKRTKPRVGVWCTAWEHTAGTHIWHTRILLHLQHQLGQLESRTTHSHTTTHSYIYTYTRSDRICNVCTLQNVLLNEMNQTKPKRSEAIQVFMGFVLSQNENNTPNKWNQCKRWKESSRLSKPIYCHLLSKYNLVSALLSYRNAQKELLWKNFDWLCFPIE